MGYGVELKSNYMDQDGINKEKEDFLKKVFEDGTVNKLKSVAENEEIFLVNEAYDNKMMHYIGVETEKNVADATRVISFPKGSYVVVEGEGKSMDELSKALTAQTFGQVLYSIPDKVYAGGPNTVVVLNEANGTFKGEMWVPVVDK